MVENIMTEVKLRNDQWRKIVTFLSESPKAYVGNERKCRRFIEGVLWMMRSGAQWRLLPGRYGNWNSGYRRFERWSGRGVWQEMFEHFANDPDIEKLMLDSRVVRAHACAAGASQKKRGQEAQALGRSRGGFSSKIHGAVDAIGNPLKFLLTAGEAHEAPHAKALIEGHQAQFVLGDKAYDAESILESISATGAEAIIPPKANRNKQREYDKELYKERHLVGRVLYRQAQTVPSLFLKVR